MNAPIFDPLQGDFPEVIEEYLEHGVMKCIAFSRRGTILAGDEVDIVTVEKDPFSDSDMSQEELRFLSAVPCPDDPQQQEKCVGSSSKLIDSNHAGSPLSEENGQNGQAAHNASSPLEEDPGGGNQSKRKRKLSEKGLKLQAEKVRKPMKLLKSSGRLSKTKNNSVVDQDYGNGLYDDDGSDDY
ncbi:protein RBL-like [Hibiscus syriacus]|uniref:protein RBL-like n=1 Tax=Hibiscus syriacus TaxID=106335 RepID=UPI0019246941|nr:protein RBL-like [Hibiscus syriacus]